MGNDNIFRFFVLIAALALGACSSSGIVPADMNLALTNVTVTQSGVVREGARFSHELREEIWYEFSKAASGEKNAKIYMEVREITYKDLTAKGYKQGTNTMVSYGRLVDTTTGEAMGEFPLKVTAEGVGADVKSLMGKEHINSELIRLMARATLDKVYGKSRALKIEERHANHSRQPYLVKVALPIQLSAIPNPVPVQDNIAPIVEQVSEEIADTQLPKVIEAPQLPVQ